MGRVISFQPKNASREREEGDESGRKIGMKASSGAKLCKDGVKESTKKRSFEKGGLQLERGVKQIESLKRGGGGDSLRDREEKRRSAG